MNMENFVSELDTWNITILKAVAELLESFRQHMSRVFQAVIDFFNRWAEENPEAAEYLKKRAVRKENYLRRLEYLKRRKKRRRRKPKHGRKRRRGEAKYEPEQKDGEDRETEES